MTRPNVAAARRWVAAFVVLLFVGPGPARADFCGRVVSVHDGDTVTILSGGVERRVRLVGIDAPERGQPYGSAARRVLSARIAGRDVQAIERGADSYGRTLARLRVDGADVNALQVRDGFAWVFRRFENDPALIVLEDEARAARRGLWADPEPVPPWAWRERHPPKPAPRSRATPAASVAGPGDRS
jgi:endonuclease YncB( thermonuclease family)